MKPKHIARARRFIGKRWYYRLRVLKNRNIYALLDKALIGCPIKDVPIYCYEMERYIKKEAYYTKKLNDGQKHKEKDLG